MGRLSKDWEGERADHMLVVSMEMLWPVVCCGENCTNNRYYIAVLKI